MALCPFADVLLINTNCGLVHPESNERHFMHDIRGFAAHSQVGWHSLFTTFNNPARQASTHFWIAQNGRLEQYVDTDIQAWAHAYGNPYYWSSEFEGMSYVDGPQEMDGDPFTSAQIDKAGELIAWLHGLSPFPVVENTTPGVTGYGLSAHRRITQGTRMATACPGKLRLSQFPELVLSTLRHLDGTPPGDDDLTPEQAQQLKDVHAWMVLQKTSPPLLQDGKIVHAGNLVGTLQTSLKEVADSIVKRLKP